MEETNFDSKIDGSYRFNQWSGKQAKIQAGVGFLTKERSFRDRFLRYSPNGDASDFRNYVTPETVFSSSNINGVYAENASELRNQYDAVMDIGAAYAMAELPLTNKLKSVFGVRAEQTVLRFTSFDPFENLDNTKLYDQVDVLPSLSLIYELQPDKMNLRLAYSGTVARPTFREIAPVTIFDFINNVNISGNPDLKITTITNLDARWEYFFGRGEMISVSGFYKDFTNPIELTLTAISEREWLYRNVDQASLFGGEVEVRKSLDFLSPALSPFLLGTNVTIIESRVDIPDDELEAKRKVNPDIEDHRVMFGQSPFIVNAFLQYLSNGGTSANLSYNVQGQRLRIVSLGTTPDIYEQPFNSLDFKISQRFGKGFQASFSIENILNAERKWTQDFKGNEYIFQGARPGRAFSLGFSYNLSVY